MKAVIDVKRFDPENNSIELEGFILDELIDNKISKKPMDLKSLISKNLFFKNFSDSFPDTPSII